MAATTPLNPVDAAWYHMDWPQNPVIVTSVTRLRDPLSLERLKAILVERVLSFERFRQRVIERGFPLETPHWQVDPHFDLDAHVHHIALPPPGGERELRDLISDLASTPLAPERPLWQMHLVDRVGSGCALILRFHHCIGDGTAMMAVASRLFDGEPGAPLPPLRPQHSAAGPFEWMLAPALTLGALMQEGIDDLRHPEQIWQQAQLAAGGVGTAALTLLKPVDPRHLLKRTLSGVQRVAYSAPAPLADIKAIGAATGAKVNDVLASAMCGALRTYLLAHGAEVAGAHIRAVVPVDLRPPERALELGNAFGLTFLELPVGEERPLGRLRAVKRGMDAIKRSPEAIVFRDLLALFGQLPKPLENVATAIFGSKATMVLTNVAGPQRRISLDGDPVEQLVFWVPHPVTLGIGISILSYNGAVTLGVIADAGIVPDPEAITEQFYHEFVLLRDLARAEAGAPVAEDSAPARCAANTHAGQRCRRPPRRGSLYCAAHQPRVAEPVPGDG